MQSGIARKVKVSAPGKLMLLGEHTVVYGRPCIVTAVGQRMKATVELTNDPVFQLNAPDVQVTNYQKPMSELGKGNIPKGAKFVEVAIKNFFRRHPVLARPERGRRDTGSINIDSRFRSPRGEAGGNDRLGIKITTISEFSSQFGFGSSSAATVCVIKALSELIQRKLSQKQIFDLSYKTVLDIQGKGSGFDVAAATFGGILYYVTPGRVIEPLKINHLPLIVGYSGIKFDTVRLIDEVAKKATKYPSVINNVYAAIGKLVEMAKKAILKKDWATLGQIMNFNEGYLSILGVEGKKLADIIYMARGAGAYGAKLSGAGVGDSMIALVPQKSRKVVEQAINKAGGQIIDVKTNVEGVKVENG